MEFADLKAPDGRTFAADAEWYEGQPRELDLRDVLRIPPYQVTQLCEGILGADCPPFLAEQVRELTWGVRAYHQFQDILPIFLDLEPMDQETCLLNRHYCYYESVVYLRESVVSSLNGSALAGLALLRPFLELSLSELYWHLRCSATDYAPYYQWLSGTKEKPPFKQIVDTVFSSLRKEHPGLMRMEGVYKTIRNIYRSLCSHNHSPKLDESLTARAGGLGEISYENILTYTLMANLLLRQVVFTYLLCYPMMLFPVEGVTKWGFSGPVGLFVDPRTAGIVEHYLGTRSANNLRDQLKDNPSVRDLLAYYHAFPDLTQEQIDESWARHVENSGYPKLPGTTDLRERLTLAKSQLRALGWATNYCLDLVPGRCLAEEAVPYECAEGFLASEKEW